MLIHHQVVLGFEGATRDCGVRKKEPVKMQHKADIDRTPVSLPDVVERIAIAGELLLRASPQVLCAASDDAICTLLVGNHHPLQRRGRLDGLDPGSER